MYHRCELHWCRQLAEETVLDVGTALANRDLSEVYDANVMLDASLPEGVSPAGAVGMVHDHYRAQGTTCHKWVLNPSLPRERVEPLAEHLLALGHTRGSYDMMYLTGRPTGTIEEVGGVTIIPARASFRHARELQEEAAAKWKTPQLTDAGMLHLEDPQSDSVMAMKDGRAVAMAVVLPVGEIGCIEDVFVSAAYRGQGIGRTIMSRALEICARSLFKHVFLSVDPTNAPAVSLSRKIGFERIGDFTVYRASGSAVKP